MHRLTQMVARLAGLGCFALAIYIVQVSTETLAAKDWLHGPSFAFIILVLSGITLLAYQVRRLGQLVGNLVKESPSTREKQIEELNAQLKNLCTIYYDKGASGLERQIARMQIPAVWRSVIKQINAKIPMGDIKRLLRNEARKYHLNIKNQIDILKAMGAIAPSIGVLGTVLGLIKLLANLDDMSTLGPNMSLALVTTLYGLFISIAIFKPLMVRLTTIRDINLRAYEQAIFWIEVIEENKPAFYCDPEYERTRRREPSRASKPVTSRA